ncbi:MAG: histidine--tRNA ligase [Synergistetes bacterium]|nr:histidine--tRNA ligase [Synergistota bacterium]MCX8128179.1 histidine--tRNA ligase [Synergistota bacterium]MDW8192555.1 histidine--tRNA ligase [Synergistota bacterium]
MGIAAPRGVRDILPGETEKWRFVEGVAYELARKYNYKEIIIPIFEHTELFSRGIGEATDIVMKEMYTFEDKAGRSLTLRPEATASIVRAYLEHHLEQKPQPQKFYFFGPMFRYERPQAGRYRQFWQLDFEALGSPDPLLDVEVIALAWDLMFSLGIRNLEVQINSIGCPKCKEPYKAVLKEYLSDKLSLLCEDCQRRYELNVLRILDCKKESCRAIVEGAPKMVDHLCADCKSHFEDVKEGLDLLSLPYVLNPYLVRGLDYYTRTTFEIMSDRLGAQNALCGGGRYDLLAFEVGGIVVPAVGFAAGLERIIMVLEEEGLLKDIERGIDLFLISLGDEAKKQAFKLLYILRREGFSVDMDYMDKNIKAQMKLADQKKAKRVLILGEDELSSGVVKIKDMESGKQDEVPIGEILAYFRRCKR